MILISIISQSRIGCNIGGLFVNILAYADDMALLAPSWYAMQEILKILEYCCVRLDILCNTKKTVCMIFKPKQKDKWITDNFQSLLLMDTNYDLSLSLSIWVM